MVNYGDFQFEIYLNGLSGVLPKMPTDFATLLRRAEAALSDDVLNYVQGGCGDELTQDRNVTAFRRWGMTPRMLVDGSQRDLSIELFGMKLPHPLFMAPIGVTGMATPDQHGDIAAAQASAMAGVPYCHTVLSNDPMEDVARHCGDVPAFFQLYTPHDRALCESLVGRAEAAGYRALVVTLDTPTVGWRPRDLNASNFPQLRGHVLQNYFSDPVFKASLAKSIEDDRRAAIMSVISNFGRFVTWKDLPWFREMTKMPIVVKGICHKDDARRAVDEGVDAIYCSNHGGRQANGGIAAIDMLPDVVEGAGGRVPVLFDSGIRSGSDVVKALALGATAVGIGRPFFYGLALNGAEGAAYVMKCILAEADLMMAVNGWPTLEHVREAGAKRVED